MENTSTISVLLKAQPSKGRLSKDTVYKRFLAERKDEKSPLFSKDWSVEYVPTSAEVDILFRPKNAGTDTGSQRVKSPLKVARPAPKVNGEQPGKRPAENGETATENTAENLRKRTGDFIVSDWFLLFVMLLALGAQATHTAGFFYHNSPVTDRDLSLALAIIFAAATDLTSLVLTAHRGGWIYLVGFFMIHLAMNINFHYMQHGYLEFGTVLLSFVLALSNFSYVELFAKRFKHDLDK